MVLLLCDLENGNVVSLISLELTDRVRWNERSMAICKALLGVIFFSTLALACSCEGPSTFCGWLKPNMVAFIGRPLVTTPVEGKRRQTVFQIQERLWGALPAERITIEDLDLSREDFRESFFVLAGREAGGLGKQDVYHFERDFCCPYGLALQTNHPFVNEFRDTIAKRKAASMDLRVHNRFIPIPGLEVQLSSPAFNWQGISGATESRVELPPGDYSVRINSPHFSLADPNRTVSILPGACTLLPIPVEPKASISGRIEHSRISSRQDILFRLEGEVRLEPAGSLWDLSIYSLGRTWARMMGSRDPAMHEVNYFVEPGPDGQFQMHVLPGTYRMTAESGDTHHDVDPPPIPKTYYPGVTNVASAARILVPPGGQAANIHFTFPDYGFTRRVEVELVNPDGSPAVNKVVAHVGVYPGEQYRTAGWAQKLTDTRGRVTFNLWQSLHYRLQIMGRVTGASTEIEAGSESVTRRFTVHPHESAPRQRSQ